MFLMMRSFQSRFCSVLVINWECFLSFKQMFSSLFLLTQREELTLTDIFVIKNFKFHDFFVKNYQQKIFHPTVYSMLILGKSHFSFYRALVWNILLGFMHNYESTSKRSTTGPIPILICRCQRYFILSFTFYSQLM